MKKITIVFIVFLIISLFYSAGSYFWPRKTMKAQKVCKRWGEKAFELEKFKKARDNELKRAQMACSLLKQQKKFVGKHRGEIKKMFGDYDGHYFSNFFPTYIIESAKKKAEDTWQIVFLIDRKEKISKIIVHRNCCD